MVTKDAVVIGCGIIGATVSAALRRRGLQVLTLDDSRPNAGTPPSGGHLKPGWFGDMKRADYEPALQLLDDCWVLKEEQFRVLPGEGTTTVYRVDTDEVLKAPRVNETVVGVKELDGSPLVLTEVGNEYRCRLLVVCTGTWAAELLPEVSVRAKQGVSFRIPLTIPQGLIKTWAPYKQVVAHQQGPDEVWVGDGTAVIPRNWEPTRSVQCRMRCQALLETKVPPSRTLVGWRPYSLPAQPGDPCLLRQLGPRAWAATGAGKMGTIAAGWVAGRMLNAV